MNSDTHSQVPKRNESTETMSSSSSPTPPLNDNQVLNSNYHQHQYSHYHHSHHSGSYRGRNNNRNSFNSHNNNNNNNNNSKRSGDKSHYHPNSYQHHPFQKPFYYQHQPQLQTHHQPPLPQPQPLHSSTNHVWSPQDQLIRYLQDAWNSANSPSASSTIKTYYEKCPDSQLPKIFDLDAWLKKQSKSNSNSNSAWNHKSKSANQAHKS